MSVPMRIRVDDHPLLLPSAFMSEFSHEAGASGSPDWLIDLLSLTAKDRPVDHDDVVRQSVRAMLRTHGYKPSGRGKPASEYLVRAAGEGNLESINLPVDLCNATSLHWQLPISVIDLERASEPFRIGVAESESTYVFNASGQEIRLDGLPCLFDADGPCANAVRDSQRTKTSASTRRTLSIVWGSRDVAEQSALATEWYRELATRAGAHVTDVSIDN
jgi:DNA/RNA-binding domain of Phe-tRNA-synthetase-like protein